jgi:hypothetical protein
MAWLKRNLFFVLSLAAGLGLTGYCAWQLTGDLGNNTEVKKDAADIAVQLEALKKKNPYPSQAAITNATKDLEQVKDFVAEVKRTYAPFPPPPPLPKNDIEHAFSVYLADTIFDLRTKATNNEVDLPENMNFGFTDQRDKLNFPLECIPLWMEQLTEIKALCDILYAAKINSLATFRRVPVSATNDQFNTAGDQLAASITNNSMATITPYKVEFRCFSGELSAVLNGLARSTNCFYPKNIVVVAADSGVAIRVRPAPVAAASAGTDATPDAGATTPGRGRRGAPPTPAPDAPPDTAPPDQPSRLRRTGAADAAPAPPPREPRTILQEHLLFVTLSLDVVNFK